VRQVIRSLLLVAILGARPALAELNWIDVDGIRVVEPPAEHPRLDLRARDLPDLQNRLSHPVLKPAWEEMQAAARESTQIRLEAAALRYLLDHDAERGRSTAAEALQLLRRAHLREEVASNSRRIGRVMVTGGHAFHQGPGYADARYVSDMYALWIFARMGAGNAFHPAQQFVPYEWIYLRRPDGAFIRAADGQNWPTRLGSLLPASYYGDGYILANYKGPLAVHSGVYQGVTGGYGSAHHRGYYQRTIAHNSLLVRDPAEKFPVRGGQPPANDGGQRIPGDGREVRTPEDLLQPTYRTVAVLGHGFGPDPMRPAYTYLKGDITAAYSAKVRQVQRSFIFLNLGEAATPAVLVVFDRVVAADPAFVKTWLLHSIEEPVLDGSTLRVTLASHGWSGALRSTALLPAADNLRIDKVGGPGKEFWVDGRNYPNETTPPDPEKATWRVEVSPRRPAAADLFLNVIEVMDGASAASRGPAIEKIESADVVGMKFADRVVVFQSSGDRADRPVAFSVRGEGTLKFVVTDLATGTWQVRRNGQIAAPAMVVSDDEGVAYFEGPAGTYELRR
jgi:hypothetical protein